jgi:hypothetical protein
MMQARPAGQNSLFLSAPDNNGSLPFSSDGVAPNADITGSGDLPAAPDAVKPSTHPAIVLHSWRSAQPHKAIPPTSFVLPRYKC